MKKIKEKYPILMMKWGNKYTAIEWREDWQNTKNLKVIGIIVKEMQNKLIKQTIKKSAKIK